MPEDPRPASAAPPSLAPESLTLGELEALRLALRGGSVINWYRVQLQTDEEIDRLLRLNGYDPDDPVDQARMRTLLAESARYIDDTFGYAVPPTVAAPARAEDVFRLAAGSSPDQKLACMTLKVAHVLGHLEGHELRHLLEASDQHLFARAEARVQRCVDELREAGVGILDYRGSRKTRDSLVTKLLSKRRTIAAQIYDKLRCRIVTATREDLAPTLAGIFRYALPFNYVVPEESRNDILPFRELVESSPALLEKASSLQFRLDLEERLAERKRAPLGSPNPFSAEQYRVINFVVDVPVRVDDLLVPSADGVGALPPRNLGRIAYVMVEFQVLDQATHLRNESGPANHSLYKRRQRQMVLKRLVWGMPVRLRPGASPTGAVRPAPRPPLRRPVAEPEDPK